MLTDFFIKRPVFAVVLNVVLLLLGLFAYHELPLREYPHVDAQGIKISTVYPGASARLIEAFITTPMEGALSGIQGLDVISSSSKQAQSTINLRFDIGTDVHAALSDVNSRISSIQWQLPKAMNTPVIEKVDPNDQPMMYLGVTSRERSLSQLTDVIIRRIQKDIQSQPGVGRALVLGGKEYAMRLWLNPEHMRALRITANDVMQALQMQNTHAPAGRLKSPWLTYDGAFAESMTSVKAFKRLVVKSVAGHPIRLEDVARVELGSLNYDSDNLVGKQPAVFLGITTAPAANPLNVANAVRAAVHRLNRTLPYLTIKTMWDATVFIKKSIQEVNHTILETAACVILVLGLFLGSMRMAFVPALTIPLSLVGTFALMRGLHFTINTLTLLAMVLAIGLVVDDAIVVLENIYRYVEQGLKASEAAIRGAREIQFAILAMTLTLAAVYAPIGLMGGLTGALFKEFSYTLASAVLISGWIAITLSPMLCAKIIRGKIDTPFSVKLEAFYRHLHKGYQRALDAVMRYPKACMPVMMLVLTCVGLGYTHLPEELVPQEDVGAILTMVQAPPNANLAYTKHYTEQLMALYKRMPGYLASAVINGMQGVNTAFAVVILKPWSQRSITLDQGLGWLQEHLAKLPGALAFPFNPFQVPGVSSNFQISFVIKTPGDLATLAERTQTLLGQLYQDPRFMAVNADLHVDKMGMDLHLDRDAMARMGITAQRVNRAVAASLGEPFAGHFLYKQRSYQVIPQQDTPYLQQPHDVNLIGVHNRWGDDVPLSAVARMAWTTQAQAINHFQQLTSVTIQANPVPGYALSDALAHLMTQAKQIFPPGTSFDYDGQSRSFVQSQGQAVWLFIAALIFIYLVLAAQYESFLDPWIVLTSVPVSLIGAIGALYLHGGTLNIYTQIGMVTLIGLISKHGILIVDFANHLLAQGDSLTTAVTRAAQTRLRPIIITTVSMILGALPLAWASGAGSVARNQLGVVIVGGMLVGTCFTLLLVPATYVTMKSFFQRLSKSSD